MQILNTKEKFKGKNRIMVNEQQRIAFNKIMSAVNISHTDNCFFLDICRGSGKTFLYNTLICV